ncbi:MAG: hypothetical protein ABI759_02625 [Candidatus Solibacter sp.]
MKVLSVVFAAAMASGAYGQAVHRSFGSVVFPGGTSSTSPNISRNFGSVVFPGGTQSAPVNGGASAVVTRPGVPAGPASAPGKGQGGGGRYPIQGGNRGGSRGSAGYVYAYPVYVGGYDNSYLQQEMAPPVQQPSPNITIIMPPQQQANPVMIQAGPDGEYTTTPSRTSVYEPRRREVAEEPETPAEATRYLLAFKDHTIYSAVAYWADGDTLHYFTNGNTHNQASLALIDRELTDRLNREMGIDFHLPPAK